MQAHKKSSDAPGFYDPQAVKKPTSFSVNSDLLRQARDLGIDLAATLEEALAAQVRKREREAWREENREAIEAYNEHVARSGVWSDGLRSF